MIDQSSTTALCLLLVLSFLMSSCSEGKGGTAGITGLVVFQEYDLYGNLFREYPAQEQRVFLVYGQDSVVSDDTRAHFNGRYRFDFLRKGQYTVYAYSDCPLCPGGSEAVAIDLEISKSGELVEAPIIYLLKD